MTAHKPSPPAETPPEALITARKPQRAPWRPPTRRAFVAMISAAAAALAAPSRARLISAAATANADPPRAASRPPTRWIGHC
jgi:hypothetical protein